MGISKHASADDIRAAYRRKALQYHPDKNGSSQMFVKINEAYQILRDPTKRSIYDMSMSDEDNSAINKLFSIFLNNFMNHVQDITKKKQNTEKHAPVVPQDLIIDITATVDEVYSNLKKIMKVKVLRENVMTPIPFLIDLKDFREPCIFEKAGDNKLADVIFKIHIAHHDFVVIDQVMDSYDLSMEVGISLYEYYFGGEKTITFLCDEQLKFDIPICTSSISIPGKGLPYENTRGDLIIFLRMTLPKMLPESEEVENFLNEYFNSENEVNNTNTKVL